jgi:hypothetical protein
MQLVDTDAPVVVRYCPAAQLVHATVPVAVANWPTAQCVHWVLPVVVANCPGAQLPHTTDTPVPEEKSPAEQPMQLVDSVAPVVVKYSPAAHAVQTTVPVAKA